MTNNLPFVGEKSIFYQNNWVILPVRFDNNGNNINIAHISLHVLLKVLLLYYITKYMK